MRVSDEILEEYAERYVNENKKQTTGLDFHEYLDAMVILNRAAIRSI